MPKIIAFTISFVLLLITPFVYYLELYNGTVSAKQIWFYGAMALLIGISGLFLLFRKRPILFRLNSIDYTLLAFYFYLLIRSAFTSYTPLLYNTKLINYTLLVGMYFILRQILTTNQKPTAIRVLLLGLILTGLGEAVWGLLQLYGRLPSFHSSFKITGTFYNPAPYALYLAVIFPLALGIILTNETIAIKNIERSGVGIVSYAKHFYLVGLSNYPLLVYYISIATVFAILLVLPATMIRASWLAAFAGSLVVLNAKYHCIQFIKQFVTTSFKRKLSAMLVLVFIGILGFGLYNLKKGSSIGKLLIWEVTLGKIAESPLVGYGVGRFEAEYNNWQASYFQDHPEEMGQPKGTAAGNTKYAFNGFLEMASETGIVGLLLFLTLLVVGITALIKAKSERRNSCSYHSQRIAILAFLISFVLSLLVSIPFSSLPTLVLFFVMLALVSAHLSPAKRSIPLVGTKWASSSMAVLCFGFIGAIAILAKNQYEGYYYWDEADKIYYTQNYSETCQSFEKVTNLMQYNGEFLQHYGKALYLKGDYNNSLYQLERARNFTTDDVLYTTLGDNYKVLKQYHKAELSYRVAAYMTPNKMYPLYLLAKLYAVTDKKQKAKDVANLVLNMNIKVQSNAITEMQMEMRKIVNETQDY